MKVRRNCPPREVKRARQEIADLYDVPVRGLAHVLSRLYWGDGAPAMFAQNYRPDNLDEATSLRLEEDIIVLAHWCVASVDEVKACLGRYRYYRLQGAQAARRRGMDGCYFLFIQRKKVLVGAAARFRVNLAVVLPEPRYWCCAQSVPAGQVVLCDKKADERGEACPIYIQRMEEFAQQKALAS